MDVHACSIVPIEDLTVFYRIERVVQLMPTLGFEVSCHILSRALARFFPVEYQDGYFGKFCEHSWLVTKNGLIIDCYPVAVVGGPILIDQRYPTPWLGLYKKSCLGDKLRDPSLLKRVDIVAKMIAQIVENLN